MPRKPRVMLKTRTRRRKEIYHSVVQGRTFCLRPDAIEIGGARFKPIEIIDAASLWLEVAQRKKWKLKDAAGLEIDMSGWMRFFTEGR